MTCKYCKREYEGDPTAYRLCDSCFAGFDGDPPDRYLPTDAELDEALSKAGEE